MGLLDMEYQIFSDEAWEAWKRFDETSKRFIGQCYYEENLKHGKDAKRINEVQTNRNNDDT